jgi:hypothetical protein
MAVSRYRLTIYDEELRRFLNTDYKGDSRTLWKHMDRLLKLTVAAAKKDVGVKTGALRASISGFHLGNITGQYTGVRAVRPYALMHHNGTRPHLIKPHAAPQLVFISKSRIIRTTLVHHPGTKPNPFLLKNLDILAGKRIL